MTPAQKFQTSQSHLEQKEHNRVHYRLTRCPFPSPQSQVKPPPGSMLFLCKGEFIECPAVLWVSLPSLLWLQKKLIIPPSACDHNSWPVS